MENFSSVLNRSKVLPKPSHRMQHFLVKEGCPVTDRLEATRKEF